MLALAEKRQLREFQDGLPFIRAKRDPTPENIGAWRSALEAHVARTGCVDVACLMYAAHLGLVEDAYRTHLMSQAGMPELRNDPRFVPLGARLGLVEFWIATRQWPDCADEVPYDFRGECANAQQVPKGAFGF